MRVSCPGTMPHVATYGWKTCDTPGREASPAGSSLVLRTVEIGNLQVGRLVWVVVHAKCRCRDIRALRAYILGSWRGRFWVPGESVASVLGLLARRCAPRVARR